QEDTLMPRRAVPPLAWSAARQSYQLSAGQRREPLELSVESPAWFAWLDAVSSFAFQGQHGSYTARKATQQRGAASWYAYRKQQGKLANHYLGEAADLTLARLEEVATLLPAEHATAGQAQAAAPAALAQPEKALAPVTTHTDPDCCLADARCPARH